MDDLAELQRLELAAINAERLAALAGQARHTAEEAERVADQQMNAARSAVFAWINARREAQRIAAGLA